MALRELAQADAEQGTQITAALAARRQQLAASDPAIVGGLLRAIHTVLLRGGIATGGQLDPDWLVSIATALPPRTPNRALLLQLLAMIRTPAALQQLFQLLRLDPPQQWTEGAQILSPLMQHDDWQVGAVFPDALDCLQFPALAAPLLDLANFLFRRGRVEQHPIRDRLPMLNQLLGEVTQRLAGFEDDPHAFGDDVETVHRMLGEAVSLAVSLCDAVGLIGHPSSIGKLNQTIELKHRRVQCEAAGALARLGEDHGVQRLIELAADPAARLRAVHYLDELGQAAAVDDQYRSEAAVAEAELALWLTQPAQMGVPPTAIEVLDTRRLIWPSFSEPIDVFLLRFEYNFGVQTYSNIGIVGPVTFALGSDLGNLPIDDIYAVYAGWHAEHDDIFAVSAQQFNQAQRRIVDTYRQYLVRLGYESLNPELLGFFLDEQAGIFRATRDGIDCLVVTDGLETIEQATAGRRRPLTAGELFHLYKGRKMLRTFNSGTFQAGSGGDADSSAPDRP